MELKACSDMIVVFWHRLNSMAIYVFNYKAVVMKSKILHIMENFRFHYNYGYTMLLKITDIAKHIKWSHQVPIQVQKLWYFSLNVFRISL